MSDLWRAERLPAGAGFAGGVKREPPVLDRQPIGPWRARVRVTPLLYEPAHRGELRTSLETDNGVLWEVTASWEHGPPLLVFNEHWTPELDGHQAAVDNATLANRDLAMELAHRAIELLRDGVRFDLQALAGELRDRRA